MNIYIKAQGLCRVLSEISNLTKEQQQQIVEYCNKYDEAFIDNLTNLIKLNQK